MEKIVNVSGAAASVPVEVSVRTFLSISGIFQPEMAVSAEDFDAAEASFSIEPRAAKHKVYNFEVEGTHTYIAGGYRVHNTSTLAFYDPEENGVLTAIYEDAQGRLVWESITPDGGKWTTVSTTAPGSPTTTVEKTYELGALNDQGIQTTRFYLKQTSEYETIDGRQVLKNIHIDENYWLYGDEIGGGVSSIFTPFILQSIGAETPFERLAAGTLIETVLQNIAEGGINALHHSILNADSNAQATSEMILGAWRDVGIDLGVNFSESIVSITSQVILTEIFSSLDIDTLPETFVAELVSKGLNNVLATGMDNFIDNMLGADSALGQAYKPDYFDFSNPASYASLLFSLALKEFLPSHETSEGSVASSFAQLVLSGSSFITGMSFFPGILATQLIGFAIGKFVDWLFDKDPSAFANLEFSYSTKSWSITSIDSHDGGQESLARSLGQSVLEKLNEIIDLTQSTDINFNADIRIGHYENNLQNGNGVNYSTKDTNVIFSAIVSAIKGITATDGDLKVLRLLDLSNVEAAIAGLAPGEAFSLLYSKIRIAGDYQFYLENTEYVNQLLLTSPDSALAKSWLATILSAESAGLNEAYTVNGTSGDNLFLLADGHDTVEAGAGNDTIRGFGGDDFIGGGGGNDLIDAGIGRDIVDGGGGDDTVTFDKSARAISLNLGQGVGLAGDALGDVYLNIEHVIGSNFSDTIAGGMLGNEIFGNSGVDLIDGYDGNDTVYGGAGDDNIDGDYANGFSMLGRDLIYGDLGDDVLLGNGGRDTVYGGTGDDVIYGDFTSLSSVDESDLIFGDLGNDLLHGGGGLEQYFGGDGFDTVSYKYSALGVIASIATGEAKIDGGVETFAEIEGLVGSDQIDILFGSNLANVLEGRGGDDILNGGRGSDTYRYSYGDGDDNITDRDTAAGVIDRLQLFGVNPFDVRFASTESEDLVITLANGERITVVDHFAENGYSAIEQIEFADGTVLGLDAIRLKSVSDQKFNGSGKVIGSDFAETYTHALGDGSYTINDYDYTGSSFDNEGRIDRLVFSDVDSDEVVFTKIGDDLKVFVAGRESIIIGGQLAPSDAGYRIEVFQFADGVQWNSADVAVRIIAAAPGDKTGTQTGEVYSHTLGDGSYSITDYDSFSNGGADRLTFTSISASDVTVGRSGNNLIFTMENGEQVTLVNQLNENSYYSIETFAFADGITLSQADLRNRMVSDMKAGGTVIGTELAEAYKHTLGDGSYSITDYDIYNNGGADSLTFTNIAADNVAVGRSGNNLIFTMENGEQVTLVNQLGSQNGYASINYSLIETIAFADGITLNQTELRNRMVSDMKAGGTVIGTELAEAYRHSLGDGSYSITDYDKYNNDGIDSLTFANINASDVNVRRVGNDIVLALANGETVALINQLDESEDHAVEKFIFADGSTWTAGHLRNRMVSDMKAGGTVIGTELAEAYKHTLGDGSYSITDYDIYNNGGADSLTFTNIAADNVTVGRSGNNLIFTMENGEQVTLVNQLNEDRYSSIETFAFADGITLSQADLRNRMVSDMKAGGTVIGTELAEAYKHTLGDGSYSITDYDIYNNGGADSLTFTNIAADNVAVGRSGNNLIFTMENGEQVTILEQFNTDNRTMIETFRFAGGVTWNQFALWNAIVEDMKQTGTVLGGQWSETLKHRLGDGSYTISSLQNLAGQADHLIFLDVNSNQAAFTTNGYNVSIALPNGEVVTILGYLSPNPVWRPQTVEFSDGVIFSDLISRQSFQDGTVRGTLNAEILNGTGSADIIKGFSGADTLNGGKGGDMYRYGLGDGHDHITDRDGDSRVVDRLQLVGINPSEVRFASTEDEDLVITLANGERITVVDHFAENGYNAIEQIEFADGTVLSLEAIVDKSVSDQKFNGSGKVIGSDFAETYTHALGDGSYTINDYDNGDRTDRLIFSNANPSDVRFASTESEDLVITLANGERVTVVDHFAENGYSAIEQIEFADGTVLSLDAIRLKSVSDQKFNGSGKVIGSDFAETYTHALGDGSYTINDYDNGDRTDRLFFSNANPFDVRFASTESEDLVITLANGERITVVDHFAENGYSAIEQIEFADGTVLGLDAIRLKSVSDQKFNGSGKVIGSDFAETYTHALGDGSYTINDYDYTGSSFDNEGRIDRLVFSDVDSDEVVFTKIGDDLKVFVAGRESIIIGGQLAPSDAGYRIEVFQFADGVQWNSADVAVRIIAAAPGDKTGTQTGEVYSHTLGDGSYSITDYDSFSNGGADRLTFTSISASDVTVGRSGNNLIFTMENGEQVTLVNQLNENSYYSIETFAFADGITLSQADLRNRMVSDMKAGGTVIGTELAEAYKHTLGDGSYSITDYDIYNNGGADSLTFTNIAADNVAVGRSGNNLIFTMENGEQVTLVNQLGSQNGYASINYSLIETIAFADGITLNQTELRNRMVSDMKAGGTVIGTELAEAYRHSLGDGSYSITDYDKYNNDGIDSLTFANINASDVNVRRVGNDIVLALANGETVALINQLDESEDHAVEKFIFADGSTWTAGHLRNRMVSDMKAGGTVIGTELAEAYKHTLGDGSYSITDYDIYNNGGADSLTFTNIAADNVTVGRSGNNLIFTMENGEQVTLVNQLNEDRYSSIETFAFADGITLSQADLRNRMVSDMKAGGTVIGTELAEAYKHTLGDGSYSITDYDIYNNGGADSLTFTNIAADNVAVGRSGNNLIFTMENGEQVTLVNQLGSQNGYASINYSLIETIAFADGITLNQTELRNRMVSDMKAGGTVIGTELAEAYRHSLGDGSYSITDYDKYNNDGIDSLTFTNINASDVNVRRVDDNMIFTLANGEQVTIVGQLNDDGENWIETIQFADMILDPDGLRSKYFLDSATIGNDSILGTGHADSIIGAAGNDTLIGLAGNDTIYGGIGSDAIYAGSGNDTLFGGEGNDTLDGNLGSDLLIGGAGDDVFIVDASGDRVAENANEGLDTIEVSFTWVLEENIENLTLTGNSAINGSGNSAANVLIGNNGNNAIEGDAGNDTIYGGAGSDVLIGGGDDDVLSGGFGSDTLIGGTGNDLYVVDSITDVVTEAMGDGDDTVETTFNYTLGLNVENLTLRGSVAINGNGNADANLLYGNIANNALNGGAGSDTLYGGLGADTLDGGIGTDILVGGDGDDIYVVDVISDIVVELQEGGNDLIQSSVAWTLGNVENLTLTGTAAINGTGNNEANVLTGNSASNALFGEAGNDSLIGGTGNDTLNGGDGDDTLIGGTGNDLYVVDSITDVVTEAMGDGDDTVETTFNYTLGLNVENLTLRGSVAINGNGNADANLLYGNIANNALNGGAGSDTLYGGLGADTLDGGIGTDILVGGDGDDIYVVDVISDIVVELQEGGNDLIQSSVAWTLGNVENLTLTGTAAINGTGNNEANVLTGNSASNALFGEAGNDSLIGGTGNDTLYGGDGDDSYFFARGTGSDFIHDISNSASNDRLVLTNVTAAEVTFSMNVNYDLIIKVSNDETITLVKHFDGTQISGGIAGSKNAIELIEFADGTALDIAAIRTKMLVDDANQAPSGNDSLTGTTQADYFDGRAGNDTLIGNAGNDTLIGGLGNDMLNGGEGSDSYFFAVGSGSDVINDLGYVTANDRLVFSDVNLLDVAFSMNAGLDLVIRLANSETVTVTDHFDGTQFTGNAASSTEAMEHIQFADGTVLDIQAIRTKVLADIAVLVTSSSDTIAGTHFADLIDGRAGNDSLTGNAGNDTLTGGLGNDMLAGGDGADTYLYASGSGSDVINDLSYSAANDRLVFSDVNLLDVAFSMNAGLDLVIRLANSETVTVTDHFDGTQFTGNAASSTEAMEHIQFADGTVLDIQAIRTKVLADIAVLATSSSDTIAGTHFADLIDGRAGNDSLTGNAGNDTLTGGLGNDMLAGGDGADTYLYASGSGSDVINDLSYSAANDRLVFSDVNLLDVAFSMNAGLDLVIRLANSETVTVTDHFDGTQFTGNAASSTEAMEHIQFADGTVLDIQAIRTKVLADIAVLATSSSDTIAGTHFADLIDGRAGNDSLTGNAGNDTLTGGLGNDMLAGGAGQDIFVFNATLGANNVDQIVSFVAVDDTIHLSSSVFIGLAGGALAANAFAANTSGISTNASERIIYETDTGRLYFDSDGAGGVNAVQFATLSISLTLTNSDFFVF